MTHRIFTIGVYGFSEETFFNALITHQIDTFCDIRMRRGMRGKKYAFVNSTYLQKKLASLEIRYFHLKELAPGKDIRAKQTSDDKNKSIKKRERRILSPAFIEAYKTKNLTDFDADTFLDNLGAPAKNIVLFCVEQYPNACHRSLVASKINADLNLSVTHILPPG